RLQRRKLGSKLQPGRKTLELGPELGAKVAKIPQRGGAIEIGHVVRGGRHSTIEPSSIFARAVPRRTSRISARSRFCGCRLCNALSEPARIIQRSRPRGPDSRQAY